MTTEALFPIQQSSPAAETPSVESALDVQIVADKRQSMVIELVGKRYTVKVPKASLALKLAVRAKQADDNPALLAQTIDEWISKRTGIRSRHIAVEETAISLAVSAAKDALTIIGVTRARHHLGR